MQGAEQDVGFDEQSHGSARGTTGRNRLVDRLLLGRRQFSKGRPDFGHRRDEHATADRIPDGLRQVTLARLWSRNYIERTKRTTIWAWSVVISELIMPRAAILAGADIVQQLPAPAGPNMTGPFPDDHWAPRTCLMKPIPELEEVADLLAAAVDAVLAGEQALARERLRQADMPVVHAYARRIMGRFDPHIHRRRPATAGMPQMPKAAQRNPSAAEERALYVRDGWRCRFCGCRVVPKEVRDRLRRLLPGAICTGPQDKDHHGAFLALTAVPDHVVPHWAGGGSELGNLVTACWPCNNGRGRLSLEEVGLIDPRTRPPMANQDHWDGLQRILQARRSHERSTDGTVATFPHAVVDQERQRELDMTTTTTLVTSGTSHKGKSRLLTAGEYWDLLRNRHPKAATLLEAFLESICEIGIAPEYQRTLVLRFAPTPGVRASVGFITTSGTVYVGDPHYYAEQHGRSDIGERYLEAVAMISAGMVRRYDKAQPDVVRRDGRPLDVMSLLRDAAAWKRAITTFIAEFEPASKALANPPDILRQTLPGGSLSGITAP